MENGTVVFEHCFSTLGCSEMSLRQVTDLARRHGIPAVELRTLSSTTDLISALAAEFEGPAGLAAFLSGSDVRIAALNTSVRLFESTDLSAIEPFIPWAEAAGAAYLRIFDGGAELGATDMAHATNLLNDWQTARQTRGLGVDLMIETHDALADYGQLADFVAQMPNAHVLWDTHHTWARGAELGAVWSLLCETAVHLHVKDSRTDSNGRRHYVLPGQGDFPMSDLITLLRSHGRTTIPLSLEWERHWHPDLPPLEEALHAARSWWKQ